MGAPSATEPLAALHADGQANVAALRALLRELGERSRELAGRKWAVTLGQLAELVPGTASGADVVAALELSRALSDLYPRAVVDELEAELNETPADQVELARILRALERNAEEGLALADQLFRTALEHMQDR